MATYRLVNPAAAKRILDSGLPLLSKPLEPSYLAFRFTISYAFIDLDAAEKATSQIASKSWVYSALNQRSAEVKDYAQTMRLAVTAQQNGEYALGA